MNLGFAPESRQAEQVKGSFVRSYVIQFA